MDVEELLPANAKNTAIAINIRSSVLLTKIPQFVLNCEYFV